jgi:hypothetical protein
MAQEKLLWKQMKKHAPRKMNIKRIENTAHPGMCDVHYTFLPPGMCAGYEVVSGFIELKHVVQEPARADTIVRIEHMTPDQKIFNWKERQAGGNCHILLWIGDKYLLFDEIKEVGNVPLQRLVDISIWAQAGKIEWDGFWECLGCG